MTTIAPSASTLALTPQAPSDRERLHKAAQAFESILVKQMLTSARAASFDNDLFSSQALGTFNAMQDERFAQIAAESGSLGFAKVIEAQLAKRVGGEGGAASFDKLGMSGVGEMPQKASPAQPEPVEGLAQHQNKGPG